MTVRGWVDPVEFGIADAHNHLWIEPPEGVPPGAPRLNYFAGIEGELEDYREAGGSAVVDCQPGGCGRDGTRLLQLSEASGVHVVASSGFHRQRYYPAGAWIFQADAGKAADYFVHELEQNLAETSSGNRVVRAGLVKIACEARLEDTPSALLEAASQACRQTGCALAVHTEQGSAAEDILGYFLDRGLPPDRLVLCHVDKRPDPGLHRELASAGALLEYDTFYRPKYDPEANLWPLLKEMAGQGWAEHIALATDMADPGMWSRFGDGPGLVGFAREIRGRLFALAAEEDIEKMTGGNIGKCLARPVHE